ncbi:MAG: hypothetical protein WCO86_16770 [Planctomycetota bacterium]
MRIDKVLSHSPKFIGMLGMFVLAACCNGADVDELPAAGLDSICGPRCVAFVLSNYGKSRSDELYKTVKATQWPEMSKGAPLLSLQEYLLSRDVHAVGAKIPSGHRVVSQNPVLIHLKPEGSGPGHYVVLLPESTADIAVLWTGRRKFERVPQRVLTERMSGIVLLTSLTPIHSIDGISSSLPAITRWWLIPVGLVLFFGVVYSRLHPRLMGCVGVSNC